jgi:hypothetical protein
MLNRIIEAGAKNLIPTLLLQEKELEVGNFLIFNLFNLRFYLLHFSFRG